MRDSKHNARPAKGLLHSSPSVYGAMQDHSMTLAQLWGHTLQHRQATRRSWQTGSCSCAHCASCMISLAPNSGYPWSQAESLTFTSCTSRCAHASDTL